MKHILFVCSGNTCRSPMAAALCNSYAKARGLDITADSAGLFANGERYSENAVTALKNIGISLSGASKQVSTDLMEIADVVYGISCRHAEKLKILFPSFADKIKAFPTDISDPFGGDIAVYTACMEEIRAGIPQIRGDIFS